MERKIYVKGLKIMYDNYIDDEEYRTLKNTAIDIINNDDTETDLQDLLEEVDEAFESGTISAKHYDELTGLIQEYIYR